MVTSYRIVLLAVAGLSAAIAIPANASPQGSDNRLAASQSRDVHQEQRITNGLADGSLSTREAAHLDRQQGRIDNSQARLASDGNFSRRDYARVNARQNRSSRTIYRTRHNGR